MTTKTPTPEALRAEADELQRRAAEIQANLAEQARREEEKREAKQRKVDVAFVQGFDAAALDRDVEETWQALHAAVAEWPVAQAVAAHLASQYRRNHGHLDLMSARGRLGMTTDSGRHSGTTEFSLLEIVTTVAQREAQTQIDAERTQA